jgi:LacI family transcriptional regulator
MAANRQIILVTDVANPHLRKIAMGVAAYAHEKGNWNFQVVQQPFEHLFYLEQDPLENLPDLRKWRADGIIAPFLDQKMAKTIHRLNVPVVGIEADYGWGDPKWGIPYFATDNEAIGQLAAKDLIERGFKHLAFCGIPLTRFTGWSERRQLAFQQCAREAGIPCSVFVGPSNVKKPGGLLDELSAWLISLEKPVGLMACYDVRARHVLMACRSQALLVPEDVAVIGVDNDEFLCELSSPPLSSIEQGSRTIGLRAALLLDQLMSGRKATRMKHVVEPDGIVTRRSSDLLSIEDPDVAAALRYIRQHACAQSGIQVPDVVRAIAVSRSGLETRFKTVVGRTIHAEIQRVQIERARQLATTTDLPLKQVALDAGFRYLQHMTTLFRRHTGQTPGEYRKRSRI